METMLLLLGILIGLLLSLVAWGAWQVLGKKVEQMAERVRGDVLLGLLVLSAFGSGVFLTYALMLSFH
jgi:hypothetical protein